MSAVLDGLDTVNRADVYDWRGVRCVVNRVAKDRSWADFTMTRGGSSWGKRMWLPLDPAFERIK